MTTRPYSVLLLDFGGVCLLNPIELHDRAERALDLPAGTFMWMGPVDPSTDELWSRMVEGDGVTEREYWEHRAADVGRAAGRSMTLRDYMELLYCPPHDAMIRPEAASTVRHAVDAGIGVSILTNDLRAFHGPQWAREVPFLHHIDHIVDGSETGVLKPHPAAYGRAIEMIGAPVDNVLFVDDQPLNVEGAQAFGIDSVWFDVAHPEKAWDEVARVLGL